MANNSTFTLNIKALFDASDVKAKVGDIQKAFSNLKLPDNLKKNLDDSFSNLNKALSDFESRAAKGIKTKADAKGLTGSMDNVIKEFTKVQDIAAKVRAELGDSVDLSKIIKLDDNTVKKLTELQNRAKSLKNELANITSNTTRLQNLSNLLSKIKGEKTSAKASEAFQLFKEGDIDRALQKIDQLIAKQNQLVNGAANRTGTIDTNLEQLTQIRTELATASQEAQKTTAELGKVTQEQADVAKAAFNKEAQSIDKANQSIQQFKEGAQGVAQPLANAVENQVRLNTELDQVKSRIQYFFGLANSINLVKRAIHSAVETVKELDAAMTETAVVTDYTVKDMWNQLPEYTKRANELGVMTKDAYESATLYFQQGLNADQAAALSVETLKMARIAGLDAAEATDRMTNALRGFNMELDTASAQRVDDVYSELAAISASDVDEISTAMTKVASLAHSANMEFETTAAFLAQIIETTRESAETAGTALKTVVARFSEVKKLVDTDQLKSTDEEGQVIDVNKVSAALRTAGIDLNKYFLGEVGLDDIFMELASKWDSLTSVQQRYIATQAAGSRQQSRFIALMQDYARTQDLVGAAYNAEGASARQFEKTQDSLQSKLARLKNAWNEFLMGITNSGVIKGVVDALTTLLNIVNKLTGAFGPATSGFLKFGVAAMTIFAGKKAFSNGGITTKAIGALGNTKVGSWLGFGGNTNTQITAAGAGFKTQVDAAGADFAAAVRGAAGVQAAGQTGSPTAQTLTLGQRLTQFKKQSTITPLSYQNLSPAEKIRQASTSGVPVATPKTLFGALGNRFVDTKIGSGVQGTLAKIPGIGSIFAGAVGGAATLAATIGGITVAAGAAAIAIKAMYDASPAGQLKIAEKYANSMSDVASNAQKAASKIRSVADQTKEYESAIRSATSVSERGQAIQDQNEYILSLLEEDATYAQYIQSTFTEGGQLYLTLDSDALAAAVDKIAEGATRASAYSNFANAVQQQQMADVYRSRLAGVNLSNRQVYDTSLEGYRQLTNEEFAKYSKYQAQIDAANIAMQNYATTAASQLISLEDTNLDSELSTVVASAIGESFNADDVLTRARQTKRGNWWNGEATDTQLRAEYSRLYGSDLEKGYDKSEVQYAIALGQVLEEEIEGQVPDLLNTVRNANGKMLLEVISGSYEGNVTNDQLKAAFDALNGEQKKSIEALLGASGDAIYDALNQQAAELRTAQIDFKKKAVATLKKSGLNNIKQLDQITNQLTISQQKKLVEIADSLSDYGTDFSSVVLDKISTAMLEGNYNDTLESFALSLSDNPILTLQALKDAAESTDPALQEIVKTLGLINKEGHFDTSNFDIFSKENLVQYFLISDAFDGLTEKIEEFREENGQLNAHNIKELANESQTLATLLDENIISANGLANAINALQEGNVAIFDLNESVLQLFDSFDSVSNAIQRAGQFIKDFDPGEDWGDAYDFIDSALERMTELVENRELGNPQLRNYWKAFFEGPLPEDLAGWERGLALIEQIQGNGGANFWTDIVGFSMDDTGNIADMGLEAFAQSEFSSYQDYIKNIAESNGYLNFTDDFYDLMLRNMGNHDYGVITDLAAIEIEKIVSSYGEGLEGNMPSKQDIQAIADAYGLDPQEILDAYTAKFSLDQIDFSQLEDKIRQFNTKASDLFEQFLNPDHHYLNSDQAERLFTTDNLFKAMGADANGNFSIDSLKVKIGQVVPEVADDSISIEEWFQEQIDANGGSVKLPVTYQTTEKLDDGTFDTTTIKTEVEVTNLAEYEAAVQQIQDVANTEILGSSLVGAFSDAQSQAEALTTVIQELGADNKINLVSAAITTATEDATSLNNELSKAITKNINIVPLQSSITIGGGGTTVTLSVSALAKGGFVTSAATGTVAPGLALTGEEDPEIVWNKEKGYAYLAGKNGPEINNLQPGDQVFNAQQTKDILKRSGLKSFAKGTINSYAGTIWKTGDSRKSSSGGGGSGSGSGGKDKTSEEWRNDLDWLYNLMEDIAELERDQKAIEEQYEDLLVDQNKTGKDLYKLLIQQLGNLYTQLEHQQFALEKREQEMREFMDITNDQDQYLWYNWQDRTLEIDWDAIDQITDEDLYKHVKDLIDEAEDIQGKIDDADDSIMDITNQIQELENIWRDTFIDFENRVLDAIIKSYQQIIDNYSELNDTLNNSNQQILDSLQKQISLERQIRDNTKTEEEIADDEARLAYLRRDTSGGNELAALQLERELAEQRESYEDTLVDQAISRLQEDNDAAAQQRERQIEIMQAQLDYQSENGEFNAYMRELLDSAIGDDGELLTNSELYNLLREQENWEAMSEVNKQVWEEELNNTFKEVVAFLLKENSQENGTFYTALTAAVNSVSTAIGSYSQAMVKLGNSITSAGSSGGSGGSGGGSYSSGGSSKKPQSALVRGSILAAMSGKGGGLRFATGGLADSTGLAWLDGTPQEPEYVLNARQTDAFLKLADVLPSMMNGTSINTSNTFGSTYVNLSVNLESVSPDYDVDRMVDLVKDKLYDSGSYRNNNVLSFLR